MRLRQSTCSTAPLPQPAAAAAAADPALALSVTADSFSTPWWSHYLQHFVAAALHTVPAGIILADSHFTQTLQPQFKAESTTTFFGPFSHQSPIFGPLAPSPHQAALCFLQPPTLPSWPVYQNEPFAQGCSQARNLQCT